MPLTLNSPAFADGEKIPAKYTQDGDNLSPPLRWSGMPDGTRSLVLIIEDPDAPNGTFRHWAVFNIPPDEQQLPESVETGPKAVPLRFGENDFGHERYDGPAPPRGHGLHHYHFRLAALDVPNLGIPVHSHVEDIWHEAEKHRLDETELVGTYERQ